MKLLSFLSTDTLMASFLALRTAITSSGIPFFTVTFRLIPR